MHRRTWDAQMKANMVIQGLQGKPIAELCHEHQISPSQYDQGRDQVLALGELTLELKKSDKRLG